LAILKNIKSMKIIFLIRKIQDYDLFSPHINYLSQQNTEVSIFHDSGYIFSKMKSHLKPRISLSPFLNTGKKYIFHKNVNFKNHLESEILKSKCNYIFSAALPETKKDKKFYNFISKKWCLMMEGTDIYFELKKLKLFKEYNLYKNLKINFYCWSNFFLNDIKKYLKKNDKNSYKIFISSLINAKLSGSFFSTLANKNVLEKKKIKKKYNIPKKKKIILYLPMPYYIQRRKGFKSAWWQILFTGIYIDHYPHLKANFLNYTMNFLKKTFLCTMILLTIPSKIFYMLKHENEKEILKNLNLFCKKNNYYLISKPRKKFPYCDAVTRYSDLVINDNMQRNFPTFIDEFLSISSLLITYNSSANFRGISALVPTINIKPDKSFFPKKNDFYFLNLSKMFNCSGVIKTTTANNFLKALKKNIIFQNSEAKMRIYKKKLLGNLDGISFIKKLIRN